MEVTMHFAGYFSENNPVNSTSKENKEVAGSKAAICWGCHAVLNMD